MMMRSVSFLNRMLRVSAVLVSVMLAVACSDKDDDDPGKLDPLPGQSTSVTYAANTGSGSVEFVAASNWSAWTDSDPTRSPGDVEWIEIHNPNGGAGEVNLNFSLERNRSGQERTAYIVVVCEDDRMEFRITQSAVDDADDPTQSVYGRIVIEQIRYAEGAGGMVPDGELHTELIYADGLLREMSTSYRDDVDYGADEDYCETVETTGFDYSIAGKVSAMIRIESTYYPSGRKEIEVSEHSLDLKDSRGVSGFYRWTGEPDIHFEMTYDSAGYLKQSRNDDGGNEWTTYGFAWSGGNLQSISGDGSKVELVYADSSLLNRIPVFDLNWVFPTDLEAYDFAAGDITRIWAVAGLLGKTSRNLATSITETDKYGTKRAYRMTYRENTLEKTVVRVESFSDNQLNSYSDWEIKYYGTLER